MATYPTLTTLRNSGQARDAGIDSARATNGALRTRVLYPADKIDFDLVHWCSTTERDALEAFYQANKLLNVDYVDPSDGSTHVVRFSAAPQYTALTPWWEARVRMREV